jgi:hypothetical protein
VPSTAPGNNQAYLTRRGIMSLWRRNVKVEAGNAPTAPGTQAKHSRFPALPALRAEFPEKSRFRRIAGVRLVRNVDDSVKRPSNLTSLFKDAHEFPQLLFGENQRTDCVICRLLVADAKGRWRRKTRCLNPRTGLSK